MTPLPSRYGRYRVLAPLSGGPVRAEVAIRADMNGHVIHAEILYSDANRRVLGSLEGFECSASKQLNRLGGSWRTEPMEGVRS